MPPLWNQRTLGPADPAKIVLQSKSPGLSGRLPRQRGCRRPPAAAPPCPRSLKTAATLGPVAPLCLNGL